MVTYTGGRRTIVLLIGYGYLYRREENLSVIKVYLLPEILNYLAFQSSDYVGT
jgi:hypothetical protein